MTAWRDGDDAVSLVAEVRPTLMGGGSRGREITYCHCGPDLH